MMSRRRASPPTIIDSIILPRVGLPPQQESGTLAMNLRAPPRRRNII